MADRTAAGIFAERFNALAGIGDPPTPEQVWTQSMGYDFSPCQMECNEALEKLGLLWWCGPNDAHDYRCAVYGPGDETCDDCGGSDPSSGAEAF